MSFVNDDDLEREENKIGIFEAKWFLYNVIGLVFWHETSAFQQKQVVSVSNQQLRIPKYNYNVLNFGE